MLYLIYYKIFPPKKQEMLLIHTMFMLTCGKLEISQPFSKNFVTFFYDNTGIYFTSKVV